MVRIEQEPQHSMAPAAPFTTLAEEAAHYDDPENSPANDPAAVAAAQVRRSTKATLSVRLDQADLDQVRELAEEQGIGPTTLLRLWIRERLRQQDPARPTTVARR